MLKSLSIVSLAAVATRLVGLLAFVVFAPLLGPEVFGSYALLVILQQFLVHLGMQGFRDGMMYAARRGERVEAVASRLMLLVNGGLFLLVAGSAPSLGQAFGLSLPGPMVVVVAALALVHPLHATALYRLDSAKRFGVVAAVDFGSAVSGLVLAGLLYRAGLELEVLVALMVATGLRGILLFVLSEAGEDPDATPVDARALIRYMAPLSGFHFVNFVVENIDKWLVATALGSAALGIYSRAQQVVMVLVVTANVALRRVLFAPLVDRAERLGEASLARAFSSGFDLILLASFPMLLLAQSVVPAFTDELLGEAWVRFSRLAQIILAGAVVQFLGAWVVLFLGAIGRTGEQFRINMVTKTILVIAVVVSSGYGLEALALGIVLARTLNLLILLVVMARFSAASARGPWLRAVVAVSLLLGAAWLGVDMPRDLEGLGLAVLLLLAASGCCVYCVQRFDAVMRSRA